MNDKKVAIDYLGCKLNQAEVEALTLDFIQAGCQTVSSREGAGIFVLNSCTVTHVADRKSRQWIRRIRRENPSALIVVTGCYAQRTPGKIKLIDENMIVLDNQQKMAMVQILLERGYLKKDPLELVPALTTMQKTRSFVRIQHGCSNGCTYCIVPMVRNECFSRTPSAIIREIASRVLAGYTEIVLTGTEIGSYCSEGIQLQELVKMILDKTQIERLRLSSLQPRHLTEAMLDLWRDNRLCPHLHISLQSGSDAVLKRMNRKYDRETYISIVEQIRRRIPDVAITTDVIVGFPGETPEEFEETVDLCKKMGFARIHVFPYSPRPNTLALEMKPLVDEKEKKRREREMLSLAEESGRIFRQRFSGRVMPVLWESCSNGLYSGLTPNYIRVYASLNNPSINTISRVKIGSIYRDGVKGEPV